MIVQMLYYVNIMYNICFILFLFIMMWYISFDICAFEKYKPDQEHYCFNNFHSTYARIKIFCSCNIIILCNV